MENSTTRQRGEDAVAGVHFQGHGAEQPLPNRIAAHRSRSRRQSRAGAHPEPLLKACIV